MNIYPVNPISNKNNCEPAKKAAPSFGALIFTPTAKHKIAADLWVVTPEARGKYIAVLEKLMKQASGLKSILIDAPDFVERMVAKVADGAKSGKKGDYGLKTYMQKNVNDFSFIKEAIKEAQK